MKSIGSPTVPSEWFRLENEAKVASPALLVYPRRIEENIRRMVAIAAGPERLRPHVKTHKMAEVVTRNLESGITRFKAATIAEAEMLGRRAVPDALLAYQPVGPNGRRLLDLMEAYPATKFSCLLDEFHAAEDLSKAAVARKKKVPVLLD